MEAGAVLTGEGVGVLTAGGVGVLTKEGVEVLTREVVGKAEPSVEERAAEEEEA